MNTKDFDKSYHHKFVVTQTVYDAFKLCSGDLNPLHTDLDFAVKKGFSQKVMYGNILNSFVSYFVGMMLPFPDVVIHSQDIFYKRPVFLDDELDFEAHVESVSEVVNVIVFKFVFRNSDKKAVANGHVQIGLLL